MDKDKNSPFRTHITEKVCPKCDKKFGVSKEICPVDGSHLVVVRRDPLIGRNFDGRFKIVRLIGKGGMGTVYEAYQESFDRKIAVKVLPPFLSEDIISVKRFFREAKSTAKLKHPNSVILYDFGQSSDGLLYIMMEYLDGEPLSKVLKKEGRIQLKRAMNILSQVCDSLYEAHSYGIVHRDLKPDNIFLINLFGQKDFVKVLDFGIAKIVVGDDKSFENLTQTGIACGTPAYMSPEQAQGFEVDHLTDIYSLGIILYHMLTGETPFQGTSPMEVIIKQVSEPPPPLNREKLKEYIPPAIENLILRTLSKNKKDRPQSVIEFKNNFLMMVMEKDKEVVEITKEVLPSIREVKTTPSLTPLSDEFDEEFLPTMPISIPPQNVRRAKNLSKIIIIPLFFLILLSTIFILFPVNKKGEKESEIKKTKSVSETILKTSLKIREGFDEILISKRIEKMDRVAEVTLKILSEPEGADVKIDNKKQGLTPLKINLVHGSKKVNLTIEKEGFIKKDIKIVPNKSQEINIKLEKIKRILKKIKKEEELIQF